ncbi:MAG: XdhC family protein [Bacteroidetes bacterium]|nr:XdhC family protein [Bacteroidota bacterium]MCW5895156.1 XdhC family protein [Bacteroidota bacterium]
MREKEFWTFVSTYLSNHIPAMLLIVVESHGSSPGRAGFKMVVVANGDRRGTIGGGVMELALIEESQRRLAAGNTTPTVRQLFHSKETTHESSGLICSGSQTILLKPLSSGNLGAVSEIVRTFEKHDCANLTVTPLEFTCHSKRRRGPDSVFSFANEKQWQYDENIGILDTVFIVGSGHVGLALSRIMVTLDFRVVIIDDRADAPTFASNNYAHEKVHCRYDQIGSLISGTGREYVAVVTTAYKSDEAALKSILVKNVQYVGLMGSAAKTRHILEDLISEGISEAQLRRIRNPIGIPIESHTPEEIAISIAAEIIKTKNQIAG